MAKKTIGCLGPAGSFSHEAAMIKSQGKAMIIFYPSFLKLIETVVNGEVDESVIPIDNLEMGGVYSGLDAIIKANGNIMVVAELIMPIKQNLIAAEAIQFSEIKKVISKTEATSQCLIWLDKNLPNVPQIEATSTSAAVRDLDEQASSVVAIGSSFAAKLYGRGVLVADIHDNPDNVTHFLFVSSNNVNKPTGNDKTSIVFTLPNVDGSLCYALMPFATLGINMVKIESRPSRKKLNDYIFWVDIEGHFHEPAVKLALERMALKTETLKIVGSYPKHG